jgi:DsbC/DsbD-like thiol-disulfide interchange protein
MKKNILVLLFVMMGLGAVAQIKDPVSWNVKAVKKGADKYQMVITATIAQPWHLYSQNMGPGGPTPTKITFNKNPLVTVIGKSKENGKLQKTYDNNFKMDVLYYSNEVSFTQELTVKAGVKTNITGLVNYLVCDDTQCLPPSKKTFDIKLQ